jgi:hypothetical protein
MAAFLTDRLLSPRAVPAVAAFPSTPRVTRRRSTDLSPLVRTVMRASGESLLFLWMLTVVAFSLVVAAGAMGFLG